MGAAGGGRARHLGSLGVTFIIVLAALQSIPDDLLKAARLDGAGAWGRFTGVTLPLLTPTLLFLSTAGVIGGLLTFGEIDLLTKGGPGERTNVVAYSLYNAAFRSVDQGKASAIAVLLFLVIALLTACNWRCCADGSTVPARSRHRVARTIALSSPPWSCCRSTSRSCTRCSRTPACLQYPPDLLPIHTTMDVWSVAWRRGHFSRYLVNSASCRPPSPPPR